MALIGSLRQQKGAFSEAFLIYNENRTVIRIAPTPIEYWLATSDSTDNAKIEAARKENSQLTLKQIISEFAEKYPFGYAHYLKTKGPI